MATNLLAAGYAVSVWNRTPGKCEPLLAAGATWSGSPAQLASSVDVLILMLTDAAAVSDVLFQQGAASALAQGSLVIDMSSIAPAAAVEHARRLQERGIDALDAPVSGGTKGAAGKTLAIMVGGSAAAFDRATPILSVLGRPTRVGSSGAGQVAKLANQVIVAISIGAVAEALTFAARAGADPTAVRQALTGGFADSRILQEHGARMLAGNFQPGGTVRNQLKDLDAALAVTGAVGVDLPLLNLTRARFGELAAGGGEALDHSALFRLYEPKG